MFTFGLSYPTMLTNDVTSDQKAGLLDRGPGCRTCAAPSKLIMTMLDTRTGKPIRLYKCQNCGQRIWDDNRDPPL